MGTFKQALKYGAILIGIYLGVEYAKGGSTLLTSGGNAGGNIVKTLQGR